MSLEEENRSRRRLVENSNGSIECFKFGTHSSFLHEGCLLPAELLLKHVFPRLPLPAIFHIRLLSKLWHDLLSSPAFLADWSRHAAAVGMHLLVVGNVYDNEHDSQLFAYCPSSAPSCPWLTLPLYSPGPQILPRPLHTDSFLPNLVADSSGGLVCALAMCAHVDAIDAPVLLSYMNSYFTIVVFNPLTGQSRTLPALPSATQTFNLDDPPRVALTMLAASTPSAYHVALTLDRMPHKAIGRTLIFTSHTNLWNSVLMPTASNLHCGNSILKADLFEWDAKRASILGYAVQSGTWHMVPGPFPLELYTCNVIPLMCIHHGRLLFAWPMCSSLLAVGFSVWEFQSCGGQTPQTSSWMLLAQTPANLQERIGGSEDEEDMMFMDYKFIHCGNLVCLMIESFDDEVFGYTCEDYFHSNLVYDLERQSWSRLPAQKEMGVLYTGGFSYQPSFTATV